MPYDASGVGSLFDQDPQMLMDRDLGHNLVQRGLAAVPGSLAPIPSEVMDRGMYVDAPDMTGDRMEFDSPDRTNDRMYLPKQSAPMRINAPVPIESQMPLDLGGYSPRTQQVQDMFRATRQQGMDSAAAESAQRQAALDQWSQGGGVAPSGRVRSSVNGGSLAPELQSQVNSYVANNPRPSPTTLNRLPPQALSQAFSGQPTGTGSNSYVPGGNESYGSIPAVRTGDAFFDDNTNWDQLAKDRELKAKNDAHFTAMNNARMGGIASDRQGAESARRNNLLEQGKSPDEVDRIMYPQRFAQPKDPAIVNAQAIDAAERQGRSNLHAIAQKFRRNGLPIDQAYAAAMNTIKTTNPADMGAVPSLPGMDPLRVIGSVGGQAGASAGAYGVGLANAQNALTLGNQTSADNRYGVDSRERVGLAQAQNSFVQGLLENARKEAELRMNQGVVNSETSAAQQARNLEILRMMRAEGVHNLPPGHPERAHYDKLWQGVMGAPEPPRGSGGAPAPGGGGAPAPAPGGGGAPAPAPAPTPVNQWQYYATNPAAAQQYLNQFTDPKERQRQEALMYSQGGVQHPSVDKYLQDWMTESQPNLAPWWPDAPWLNDNGTLAQRAAEEAAAATGIPQATALQSYRRYYGLPSQ
jgi:hypothetical protein